MMSPFKPILPAELDQEQEIGKKKKPKKRSLSVLPAEMCWRAPRLGVVLGGPRGGVGGPVGAAAVSRELSGCGDAALLQLLNRT